MKPTILLDCDTGIDDALTLLYLASLVKEGHAELAAVGTVHGNVPADIGAFNTLRILELAGLPAVPVAIGAAAPMAGQARYAYGFHGADGLGDTNLPEPYGSPVDMSAPDQIIRLARSRPGELTLLAIGPLTNLAIALLLEPSLTGLVRQVIVMGVHSSIRATSPAMPRRTSGTIRRLPSWSSTRPGHSRWCPLMPLTPPPWTAHGWTGWPPVIPPPLS